MKNSFDVSLCADVIDRKDLVLNQVIGNNSSVNTPVLNNQNFYQELEEAVKKHITYLKEVKEMEVVNPSKYYLFAKRSIDIIFGLFGLILLSPLILIVAILIKLDSEGPVFYLQERVGKKGKIFKIYKFRTMKKDAEEKTGPAWATENDPRITYIGRMLRKTKIDEIPQFINLIMGNMSLVGSRPERPCFVDKFKEYIPGYERRLDVLPGITGIAQLRNGYDENARKLIRKLRFEITYIKKMSLSMDIKLIIETMVRAIKGKL